MQQQVNNIKERLNIEVEDFAANLQEHRSDMLKRTGDLSTEIMNMQYQNQLLWDQVDIVKLQNEATSEIINGLNGQIRRLNIGLVIALLGVVGCLIKLLI